MYLLSHRQTVITSSTDKIKQHRSHGLWQICFYANTTIDLGEISQLVKKTTDLLGRWQAPQKYDHHTTLPKTQWEGNRSVDLKYTRWFQRWMDWNNSMDRYVQNFKLASSLLIETSVSMAKTSWLPYASEQKKKLSKTSWLSHLFAIVSLASSLCVQTSAIRAITSWLPCASTSQKRSQQSL